MSMDKDLPDIEIGYSRWRLVAFLGLGLLMTAATAFVTFMGFKDEKAPIYVLAFCIFGLIFCGLIISKLARQLASWRKPVVFISRSGIRDTRISDEMIDWTSVENISIWQYQNQKSVVLKLVPLVADRLVRTRWKRFAAFLNRLLGVDGLIINCAGLAMNGGTIFETCKQYRASSLSARRVGHAPLQDINDAQALAEAPGKPPSGLARLPWVTFFLLAVLITIFVLENVFAVTANVRSNPSLATLFALGGLSSKAVLSDGQWYRLFTAPLMHANSTHITGNCIALLLGGWFLESVVGRLWFFALFVIGALGGSLMSLAVISPNTVSVGASGALMGLFAASCIISFRLPKEDPRRQRMQANAIRILIPSLIPILSASHAHIDYGAHFGGALSGAAAAAGLLNFWPQTERLPQLRKMAIAIVMGGIALFTASAGMVAVNYPAYRAAAAQPIPATIPRPAPSPPKPPNAPSQAAAPAPQSPYNVLLDHGPGRVACDLQWSKSLDKSPDGYADFLRNCMKK